MSGMSALCLLLLCFLAVGWTPPAEGAYTMDETCFYYGNGYIGNPANCNGWGLCQNGLFVHAGSCGQGLLYNMRTGNCEYPATVNCTTTVQDVCSKLSSPQLIMDPNNCQRFCECSSTTTPSCNNCPTNQMFDQYTQACIWNTGNKCSTDSICRLVPNNKFVSDPNNCGAYLRCEDGIGISGKCTTGGYNQLTGYCQSQYVCNGGGDGGAGVGGNLPSNPAVCAKATLIPQGGYAYVADEKTCFGYYACNSAEGPGAWGKCPFATHFDSTSSTCVTPYTVNCGNDRCGNLNLNFVAVPGNNCASYKVCNNQTSIGTQQSCAAINKYYPYFDEVAGVCTSTAPKYPICTV